MFKVFWPVYQTFLIHTVLWACGIILVWIKKAQYSLEYWVGDFYGVYFTFGLFSFIKKLLSIDIYQIDLFQSSVWIQSLQKGIFLFLFQKGALDLNRSIFWMEGVGTWHLIKNLAKESPSASYILCQLLPSNSVQIKCTTGRVVQWSHHVQWLS
jgi:hypothetical protein